MTRASPDPVGGSGRGRPSEPGGGGDSEPNHTLVLGGGGLTGIAWITGLLLGLEESGFDVRAVGRVLGTSAGAVVGAQVLGGAPLRELYERQVDPDHQVPELVPGEGRLQALASLAPAMFGRGDALEKRRRVGEIALQTATVDPARRRAVIAARLPVHDWPEVPLGVVAVDALSGEVRCFGRDSGVDLVDAVCASCAVPGLWPTVRIGGRPYMDGGIPSPENLLHARGQPSVLVLAPMGGGPKGKLRGRLREEVSDLEASGSRVRVVTPDADSKNAMGTDALDPAARAASARAGRRQGREST